MSQHTSSSPSSTEPGRPPVQNSWEINNETPFLPERPRKRDYFCRGLKKCAKLLFDHCFPALFTIGVVAGGILVVALVLQLFG
ncbi:uncharacterized protein BJX67DRAFT_342761 [Aspergillus lucknowensis]|uniref:Uncharacterized protein n=1 Tax=Aspergillus lucknowensis TaxID=176173 RepID=A0ABR4M4Y0_9EURO